MLYIGNSKSNYVKNGWLRNYIFSKKRNYPYQNQISTWECDRITEHRNKDEITKENIYRTTDKKDQNLPVSIDNPTLGRIKDQKWGVCRDKKNPTERRGYGFHFYVCIDNFRKSDLLKNNEHKKIKCRKNKSENKFISVDVDEARGKKSTTGNFPKITQNQMIVPADSTTLTESYRKLKSTDEIQSSRSLIEEGTVKDQEHIEKQSFIKQEESKPVNKNIIPGHNKQAFSMYSLKDSTMLEAIETGKKIRFSSKETYIGHNEKEQTKKHEELKTKNIPTVDIEEQSTVNCVESEDKAAVNTEIEATQQKNIKRSSTNTFVRNSLISLRRRKSSDRTFLDELMVSQILSKLNSIEDKITELEKASENRGKHVKNTVSISCNHAKSTVSIKCLDKKDDYDDPNAPATRCSKTNGTVVIKFRRDDVVVNDHKRGSKSNKNRTRMGSDQLVYHKTCEIDAHRIASDSQNTPKPKRYNHPKTIVQTFHVHSLTTSPTIKQPSHMWRRVSEELKLKEAHIQ